MMFRTRIVNNISVSGGIAGVFTAGGEAVEELAPPEISFASLPKLFPPETWERPLCLLVDEIQKVTKRHENCLQLLHLGVHGLPIVTVAAGLADSVEKLNEAMSPRLSRGNIRTLGALVPDEVRSCVKQMFDRCRIEYSADRMDGIAAKIAERSEGWPQHVSDETSALFAGLDKTRGILSAVDFREVDRLADGYRKDSYAMRLSNAMDYFRSPGRRLGASDVGKRLDGIDRSPDAGEQSQTKRRGMGFTVGNEAERFLGTSDSSRGISARCR